MTELYGDHMMSQEKDSSIREYLVLWAILLAFNFVALWVLRGSEDGDWSPGWAAGCTAAIAAIAALFKLVAIGWRRWRPRRVDSGVEAPPAEAGCAPHPMTARWRALPAWARGIVQWSSACGLVYLMGLALGHSPADAARFAAWIWLLVTGLTALAVGWHWARARSPRRH